MKKHHIITVLVVLFAAAAVVLYINSSEEPPELVEGNEENVKDFLASNDFSELPQEQKQDFLEKMRDSEIRPGFRGQDQEEMSEEEKERIQKIRKNVGGTMRTMMMERVNTYHDLPEGQKELYLDQVIDDMQKRMKERDARREAEGREPGEGRGQGAGAENQADERPRGQERMKQRLENSDPVERAKMSAFMEAMRDRMSARNIDPPRFGPGGRGRP